MKHMSKLLATIFSFSLLFTIGCGGGDDSTDPGPDGNADAAIIGTWEQGTITGNAAETFEEFTITISTTNSPNEFRYAATNTNPLVFPASGTFTDVPAEANFSTGVQVNNGDTPVTISVTGDNKLVMVFTVAADSGVPADNARVAEVAGEYNFTLDKQE